MPAKPTWKELLARSEPLILPCAHDALSARLIERAGFAAYSVGGYALVGARHALPDIGLVAFGEMSAGIRDIMAASSLPVLVDCDDGYGDAKNVARTIAGYEAMGVSAIFMEDQRAPKRCGHMAGKDVIDADAMAAKLRAAVAARRGADLFIIARTDARAVYGLDEALRRAEIYLKAGADGLFIEAPQSIDELTRIGRMFQGVPQLANMVEGGGRTPVLPSRAPSRTRSPISKPAAPRARTTASTSTPSRTSRRSPIGPRWSNAPRIRENDARGGAPLRRSSATSLGYLPAN